MKILGIVGSPRKGGNTEILVEEALTATREAGAQTKVILLVDKNIAGCDGCSSCFETGVSKIKDDRQSKYQQHCSFPFRRADRWCLPGRDLRHGHSPPSPFQWLLATAGSRQKSRISVRSVYAGGGAVTAIYRLCTLPRFSTMCTSPAGTYNASPLRAVALFFASSKTVNCPSKM